MTFAKPNQAAQPTQTQVRQPTKPIPQAGAGNRAPVPVGNTPSLIRKFSEKYSVDADKLTGILKATAFKVKDGEVTNEQMAALLIVADNYELNPFTKEIFAFPDKQNGIVPVVSVDGWTKIINQHPQMNGVEFRYSEEMILPGDPRCPGLNHPAHEWMEAVITRRDREHPIVVREYFDEVYRKPIQGKGQNGPYTINTPWQTHPKRLHRHKTLIQAARIAIGFAGIYDEDEAHRIIESTAVDISGGENKSRTESAADKLKTVVGVTSKPTSLPTEKPEVAPEPQAKKPNLPGSKEDTDQWVAEFRKAMTDADVEASWSGVCDLYESANVDIPLEIEAEMRMAYERIAQK